MIKKYFENKSEIAIFLGGKLLQPGEGREFNADELPSEHQQGPGIDAAVEKTPAERITARLSEELSGNVARAVAFLPGLSKAELEELLELELAGAKRKGVLNAVESALLAQASAKLDGGTPAATEPAVTTPAEAAPADSAKPADAALAAPADTTTDGQA